MVYSPEYIRNRITKIDQLFDMIDNFGETDDTVRLEEHSMTNRLREQLKLIDKTMPKKNLDTTIMEFMGTENPDKKIACDTSDICMVKYLYDDVITECFILQQLLEFGVVASLGNLPNMTKSDLEVVDIAINYGPYHLFELFHKNDEIRSEMIKTFVKYNYHSPNINKNTNAEYLEGFKERLVYEYSDVITYRQKTNSKINKNDLNKISSEEIKKFIENNTSKKLVMKKGQ